MTIHIQEKFRGAARQCGQGWSARPENNSRTRAGEQQDERRQEAHKTRAQNRAIKFRGAASQRGTARPKNNSRAREGLEKGKSRRTAGQE